MAKKKQYEVKSVRREDFENLMEGQREALPKGSILDALWTLTKYSEHSGGYTAKELSDYFKMPESRVRAAVSGLNRRGYFVTFVCESKNGKVNKNGAGVLRDVFSSDITWETAWARRIRQYLLPHMQMIAHFGELTAVGRPQMLPMVAELMDEANREWMQTRKALLKPAVKSLR